MRYFLLFTLIAAALSLSALSTASAGGSDYKAYRDRLGFGGG